MGGAYKQFLRPRVIGGAPIIDPLSLPGIEVYLRSDNTDGVNLADPVTQWFDLSGNNRTFFNGAIGANTPTLRTNATPTGKPLVRFDGGADPNGDFMSRSIAPVGFWPSNALGSTYYFIGDFSAVPAHANGEVIMADQTAGRPQLIMSGNPGATTGWRDDLGFHLSGPGGFTHAAGLSLVEWVFLPGSVAFQGTGYEYQDGNLVLQDSWGWNNVAAGSFLDLGMGPLSVSTAMDLGLFLWFSRGHNTAERLGIRNFFANFFGSLN